MMRKEFGRGPLLLALGLSLGWIGATSVGGFGKTLQAATPSASGTEASMTVVGDSANPGVHTLYLLDSRQKTVSVYRFDSRKERLQLSSVRHYAADHQLAEYNNDPPTVADIERLTRQR